MSNTLAIDLPDFLPAEREVHPRHIEIVSSRSQKRARPRVVYALVAVAGLFVILMAQLLLSIWLSDGAYQISGLQQTQRDLSRDQQALAESLNVLQSPQNLAGQATALGMVMNTGSQGFLSLSGGVTRAPTPAAADTTVAADAATYTPNALITPDISALGATAAAAAAASATGAPAAPAGAGSVASTPGVPAQTVLPSPITH
ncbi:hypothetical protein F1C58_06675 [Glaciihabitans sp. INWT7]|uniref:hypothetical protein n=1 Tax=Glaciihabitans sp. INWT7 TaxID=2596912 RepID=UPI001629D118|nr:hypothetical protein [Glaciihabitans sp. INWT7]QNE46622.1 hypothetical protein F1C58_06675 [Glaciihabitans sp. INWT7]